MIEAWKKKCSATYIVGKNVKLVPLPAYLHIYEYFQETKFIGQYVTYNNQICRTGSILKIL